MGGKRVASGDTMRKTGQATVGFDDGRRQRAKGCGPLLEAAKVEK